MMFDRNRNVAAVLVVGLVAAFGCEKSQEPTAPASAAPQPQRKPASESAPGEAVEQEKAAAIPPSAADAGSGTTKVVPPATEDAADATPPTSDTAEHNRMLLDGITMEIPKEWVVEAVPPGPMAPKAILTLPRANGDDEDGEIRVTHFPRMKGMDDANIQRWLGQVRHPDGSSYSLEQANVTVKEQGDVRVTMLDMSGSVSATMTAEPKAGHRMIAAIVDHPDGPHFVVTSGPAATIEKWRAAILAFLTSAETR